MKPFFTIILLVISNIFMTFAWYGHLKFKTLSWGKQLGLFSIILISWGLAFFEYVFQVPANKMGFKENGGPFSLVQLKILQEVITLVIFVVFTRLLFQNEALQWNHYVAFLLIIMAVGFVFYQ